MSNLILRNASVVGRESYRTSRALTRLDEETEFGLARIDSIAELQAERVMAVGHVTEKGLYRTALIGQAEFLLGKLNPGSVSYFEAVAQAGVIGVVQIVSATAPLVLR